MPPPGKILDPPLLMNAKIMNVTIMNNCYKSIMNFMIHK